MNSQKVVGKVGKFNLGFRPGQLTSALPGPCYFTTLPNA